VTLEAAVEVAKRFDFLFDRPRNFRKVGREQRLPDGRTPVEEVSAKAKN
jgi:hypothetical protein